MTQNPKVQARFSTTETPYFTPYPSLHLSSSATIPISPQFLNPYSSILLSYPLPCYPILHTTLLMHSHYSYYSSHPYPFSLLITHCHHTHMTIFLKVSTKPIFPSPMYSLPVLNSRASKHAYTAILHTLMHITIPIAFITRDSTTIPPITHTSILYPLPFSSISHVFDIQRAGQEPEEIIHQISKTNPTLMLKSTRPFPLDQIRAVLELTETTEESYGIYLLPPGEDPEACQSYRGDE